MGIMGHITKFLFLKGKRQPNWISEDKAKVLLWKCSHVVDHSGDGIQEDFEWGGQRMLSMKHMYFALKYAYK